MKDLKISKELLSEVLGCYPTLVDYNEQTNEIELRNLNNDGECVGGGSINIYELAHKCKEWALHKGFQIISGLSDEPAYRRQDEKAYAKINYYTEDEIGNREYKDMYIMANTEIEAVFKASEYVLKEANEYSKRF